MTKNLHAAKEAIRRSQLALRKGEKDAARRWAEKAAKLAPELEEPWLFLAAVSRPQVSIHYLERALKINPTSERARKGMLWARKQLAAKQAVKKPPLPVEKPPEKVRPSQEAPHSEPVGGILNIHTVQQVEETKPARAQKVEDTKPTSVQKLEETKPAPAQRLETTKPVSTQKTAKTTTRGVWRQSLPALLLTVLLVSLVWALFPRISSFAAGFKAEPTATLSQEHWGAAEIDKPTYTPTATPTFTPTPTPTITPSPTATLTPTLTPKPTKTPYPTAKPEEPPAPASNPASSGAKYVLVDISEQHMYVYEGNTLIYSFVASTGMNNATATGHFSVLNKIPSAYGATWDIWMPYWLGIYWAGSLQNGIHALPIMSNGSILWDGYLGTPISYGCVVLGTYEAKLLYDWVDVGTPVDIQW